MNIVADLSLYPLKDGPVPEIIDFIRKMQERRAVSKQSPTRLSTQLRGEFEAVTGAINHCMRMAMSAPNTVVLVVKYLNVDLEIGRAPRPDPGVLVQLTELQWWEILAVLLAVVYLVLAIRQNIWCWAAAAAAAHLLYLFIMYQARLYMESVLQLFYLAMAAYGWYQWRQGGAGGKELDGQLPGHGPLSPARHWLSDYAGVYQRRVAYPLQQCGIAIPRLPDDLGRCGRHLHGNPQDSGELDLLVRDRCGFHRTLYLSAISVFHGALFSAYLVMIVIGYRSWRASMLESTRDCRGRCKNARCNRCSTPFRALPARGSIAAF